MTDVDPAAAARPDVTDHGHVADQLCEATFALEGLDYNQLVERISGW